MSETQKEIDIYHNRTRAAFLWSRILKTPFWAIYTMLPFILYKDLNATPVQIAVMIALKPSVSLFSMYWSAAVKERRDRLVANIAWAGVLSLLPFFFFPFVNNPWYFVFSFGLYMMLHRGVIPAWMEVMKLNISSVSREKVFAYGSAFGYLGDAILPFLFGPLLDSYFQAWRWVFPCAAIISVIALYFQCRIPVRQGDSNKGVVQTSTSFVSKALKPWKDSRHLLTVRPDFRAFQIGFMLGGSGLMIMQAVLPAFFMGVLHLSYTELAIALTLCKGIGFALTSQVWARWMSKIDIYRFSSVVTLVAFFFPVCLLAANIHVVWVYMAYILYGVMQAGSELSWNLSGPIFAKEQDSSGFSSVNVLTVGLRGLAAPWLGALLIASPSLALVLGGVLCLAATFAMASQSRTRGALLLEEA